MPSAAVATKANPLLGGSAATSASDLEAIARLGQARKKLKEEIAKVIVGQEHIVDQLLTALFARGHCLMIGVPGLAKTLMARTIAAAIDLKFNRIQFTPDLMPSDITGTEIIEEDRSTGGRQFRFVQGPGLRQHPARRRDQPHAAQDPGGPAPGHAGTARSRSAGRTYPLPAPFFVLATQNPIEQEGTYPLARGPARPFHVRHPHQLPQAARGAGDRQGDDGRRGPRT